jgi:pyruvate/2-oxoglutarate dehydrogenase complex dihydrolipoamide acyltransferase (E2) component
MSSKDGCTSFPLQLCETGFFGVAVGMAEALKVQAMQGANVARIASDPPPSGSMVEAGQLLFEVENHKVVQEFDAPARGTLVHALAKGDFIRLDMPFAFVAGENDDAAALLEMARAAKVEGDYSWDQIVGACSTPTSDEGRPVSIAKATEIAVLGNGAGQGWQATLGAAIGPIWRGEATANFFQDKITDLLVYEASRLLATKKFRVLNARFANGQVIEREHINAGVSFDEGKRLTLYAIEKADTLTLPQVQDALVDGLMRYVGRRLALHEVAGATFTISDVTTTDLDLSVPLLPRGQCIIIVLIKDAAAGYKLSISYDHRITEGLTVAGFAEALVARLRSYSAPPPHGEADTSPAICAYCERTVETEVVEYRRRGLLKIIDESGEEQLCCSTCWENW